MTPAALVAAARECRTEGGACLQVALELGGPTLPIYASSVAVDAPIRESTVAELLPNGPFVRR